MIAIEGGTLMLYVATVHYKSPRWIDIQARYLRRNITVPYQVWTSIEGIDLYTPHRLTGC